MMKTENDIFAKTELPAGLEARLEKLIDRLNEEENRSQRKTKQIRLWITSTAAGIALLVSAGWLFYSDNKNVPVGIQASSVMTNPEAAYAEAQKALTLVSENFNKGMNQWAIVTNEIEKSNNILNKTLKR